MLVVLFIGSDEEVEEWLDVILCDVVVLCMVVDVLVGVFLFGGIDLLVVVVLM